MALVDLLLFIKDSCNIEESSVSFSASSTKNGYAVDNAREADLVKAWQPSDGTSDQYIQVDGGSTGWVGSGTDFYIAVAYDARGAHQTAIRIQYDAADNPAFTSPTTMATITLNASGVACDFLNPAHPIPAKRYYRAMQLNSDRGGGTVCAKILSLAFFNRTNVLRFGTTYPGNSQGAYSVSQIFRVTRSKTAVGGALTNSYAAPGHAFSIGFQPGGNALYEDLVDRLGAVGGPARAFFAQKEGIRGNPAKQNFFMVRQASNYWEASKEYDEDYNMALTFETESWL